MNEVLSRLCCLATGSYYLNIWYFQGLIDRFGLKGE